MILYISAEFDKNTKQYNEWMKISAENNKLLTINMFDHIPKKSSR